MRSELLLIVWNSHLTVVRRHGITVLILYRRYVSPVLVVRQPMTEAEHLIVTLINENNTLSYSWSFCRSVERHNHPKCWPRSVLLSFRYSNRNRTYWFVQDKGLIKKNEKYSVTFFIMLLLLRKAGIMRYSVYTQFSHFQVLPEENNWNI